MKNIYYIKFSFVMVLLLAFTSCENELDLTPRQSISEEDALGTENGLLGILIGTYGEAGDNTTFGGESQITSDLLGNTNQVSWNGTFVSPREFFTKSILIENAFVSGTWTNHYQTINQANLVIDNVDVIVSSEDLRNRSEGEAKFLRALCYFDLVRLFAQQYEPGADNTQLGVPLRLVGKAQFTIADSQIERSTVEQIYDVIIEDLLSAFSLLPETNGIFADRFSAQALLARVYLQQGDYEAARDAAHNVLVNSGHSLAPNFAAAFNNDSDSVEDLFAIQVTTQDGENSLITFYASQANGGRGQDISIEPSYFDLFDDPDNDQRASFFYANDPAFPLTSKYINQFANIPILRIAEMHLIRAESNFRLSTNVGLDPLNEINALRARSMASPLSGPLTLDLILNERQLELGFEGHLLHDFQRTDRAIGEFPADANNLILPIPQTELNTNDIITQNPGYGG